MIQTRTYSKGTPGSIRSLGRGQYEVQSWTDPDTLYLVDLNAGRCNCPATKPCKHLVMARTASYEQSIRTAQEMTEEELERHSRRTNLRPEQLDAIREVWSHRYL